jgi:dTDP-4-dehydrorhamnose reductase
MSTDYVFDGTKASEYDEGDRPGPLNTYGRTKLAGEGHVMTLEDALVIRTSWVFGLGRNFVASILATARRDGHVRVVDDQRGRPTSAAAVAQALADLAGKSVTGIVHVSGDGPVCSWADLAVEAISAAGVAGRVERISTEDYIASAPEAHLALRPANSALSLAKARSLGVPLSDWRRSVHDYVRTGA